MAHTDYDDLQLMSALALNAETLARAGFEDEAKATAKLYSRVLAATDATIRDQERWSAALDEMESWEIPPEDAAGFRGAIGEMRRAMGQEEQ